MCDLCKTDIDKYNLSPFGIVPNTNTDPCDCCVHLEGGYGVFNYVM